MIATSPAFGLAMRASHSRGCSRACVRPSAESFLERQYLWVGEAAQALHVEHHDLPQAGRAFAHRQDLVELLLVLHEQVFGVAVVDQVLDLGRRIGRVDAGRDARRAQHAQVAEQPFLVVVGEDRRALARLQPERDEPRADRLGGLAVLAPGVGLPDAAVLLAHGHLVAARGDAMPEQGRHRLETVELDRLRDLNVHVRASRALMPTLTANAWCASSASCRAPSFLSDRGRTRARPRSG